MTSDWFYSNGTEQIGPITEVALKDLIKTGAVKRNTLIWKEGMAEWTPAGQVPGIFSSPPPLPSATPPPPLPQAAVPTAARPRKALRFEAEPASAPHAVPPPVPRTAEIQEAKPAEPTPKRPVPTRPPLSVNGAIINLFVLMGSIMLAAVAAAAGNATGLLVFMLIMVVCALAFWVRVSTFLYKAWAALPWKAQATKPALAAAAPWIPLANLALIFKAVLGLTNKTNEILKERGQGSGPAEGLATAVCVSFVLMITVPLAIQNSGVSLYLTTAASAVMAFWLASQCKATNLLIGHDNAPTPSLGLRIGVLACGAVSLCLAVAFGISSLRGPKGSGQPVQFERQDIFNGQSQNPELQEMVQQEAQRNRAFAEQLRNIRSAYSGGRIQWSYPPQTPDEARLRQLIEAEARRNAEFLDQLQQIRNAYQPAQ
ncbi:MAG: DUF4339 domain-containing protein [Planctomycetota bacterium]|nr:DUF4339 domain-containing protein [Planctomycetota bacterium]